MSRAGLSALALWAALACPAARAGEDELARRLPAATLGYARLDAPRVLEELRAALEVCDSGLAENAAGEFATLVETLRELAAQREFTPRVFADPGRLGLALAVLACAPPREQTVTVTRLDYDPETGGVRETQAQETRRRYAVSALIVETEPELAGDLLAAARGLAERQAAPGAAPWRELEVDQGELLQFGEELFAGRLEGFFVLADAEPRELWQALLRPPAETLASTAVYQRLAAGGEPPVLYVQAGLAGLLDLEERRLGDLVEAARRQAGLPAAGEAGGPGEAEEGAQDWRQWEARQAEESLARFRGLKTGLGLDRLTAAGLAWRCRAQAGEIQVLLAAAAHFQGPPPPALAGILEGQGTFRAAPLGPRPESLCLLWRLHPRRLLEDLLPAVAPLEAQQLQFASTMARAQLGFGLEELLAPLAGDACLVLDLERALVQVPYWDEEAGEVRQSEERQIRPRPAVFLGLADAEAARRVLAALAARASSAGAGVLVRRQAYQEVDVYLLAPGQGEQDVDPAQASCCLAVLGAQLAAGSWEAVTEAMRRQRAGAAADPQAAAAAAARPQANLLAVVPAGFLLRAGRLRREQAAAAQAPGGPAEPFDPLREFLEELLAGLPPDDAETGGRLKQAGLRLVGTLRELAARAPEVLEAEPFVLRGEWQAPFYELTLKAGARRRR